MYSPDNTSVLLCTLLIIPLPQTIHTLVLHFESKVGRRRLLLKYSISLSLMCPQTFGHGKIEKITMTLLQLSGRAAVMLAMYHEKFPESAGTSVQN